MALHQKHLVKCFKLYDIKLQINATLTLWNRNDEHQPSHHQSMSHLIPCFPQHPQLGEVGNQSRCHCHRAATEVVRASAKPMKRWRLMVKWLPNSYVGVIETTVWPILIFVQCGSDKEDSVWLWENAAVHLNPWLAIRGSLVDCELHCCRIQSMQGNFFLHTFPRLVFIFLFSSVYYYLNTCSMIIFFFPVCCCLF